MEFEFQIVPYVANKPVVHSSIYVQMPEGAEQYVQSFVTRIQQADDISTPEGRAEVHSAQGQVGAMLAQIKAAGAPAKEHLNSMLNSVRDIIDTLSRPVEHEQKRLGELLALEAAQELARRESIKFEIEEKHRKEVEAKQAEELRLREEIQKLRISARNDVDLEQAFRTRKTANKLEEQLFKAEYELDLAKNTQVAIPKFTAPLVEGARSPEKIVVSDDINLENLLIQSKDFIKEVVTVSPEKNVIKSKFKRQREDFAQKGIENPTKEAIDYFELTGIKITVSVEPQVRKSARIVK